MTISSHLAKSAAGRNWNLSQRQLIPNMMGMPDDWETKKGLNPNEAVDRNKVAEDGFTMLEKYLYSIIQH